jgi:hypothetical protein
MKGERMNDEEPRFIQMGRTIESDMTPLEEAAVEILASLQPNRIQRVVDEAVARHEIRLDVWAVELGEDPEA